MDVAERDQILPEAAKMHWYYQAKFELLKRSLLRLPLNPATFTCADVGCGIGLFLNMMEEAGLAAPDRSVGVDSAYPSTACSLNSKIPIYPRFPENRAYDCLILMDVLEHVPDDVSVLGEAVQHLKPGGFVFITVPAIPFLFSSHDRFLGHQRRYTLRSLRRAVAAVPGLTPLSLHYFFAGIFLPAAAVRIACRNVRSRKSSDMGTVPNLFNRALLALGLVETKICRFNRLAGLTAVAVCQLRS